MAGAVPPIQSPIISYLGDGLGRIMSAARKVGAEQSRFGPATTFAGLNALIEIHQDTPVFVRRRFAASGLSRLRFQFIEMPIEESMDPQFEHVPTLGRSEPYVSYSGGENREVRLGLVFCSSVDQGDNGHPSAAIQNIRWLQALTMPTYGDGGIMYPPPLCRLILGRVINARGLVKSVGSPSYEAWTGDFNPFEYPLVARCNLQFMVVNSRPLEAIDFLPVDGLPVPI